MNENELKPVFFRQGTRLEGDGQRLPAARRAHRHHPASTLCLGND